MQSFVGFSGTGLIQLAPLLGPLQNNGGPTATLFPQPGSPAQGAGDPRFATLSFTDQRGFVLPVGADKVDVGSVEVDASAPAVTAATMATAPQRSQALQVTLTGTVTSAFGTVNGGTFSFTVHLPGQDVTVTSGAVVNGTAQASFTLPGGTPAGSYGIDTSYSGFTGGRIPFTASTNNDGMLVVNALVPTTTQAQNAFLEWSFQDSSVTLRATVTSDITVDQGSVKFSVISPTGVIIGTPQTVPVVNGSASASYPIPRLSTIGNYTIKAEYVPGPAFTASIDTTHKLTIGVRANTGSGSTDLWF
jgi:hypothetical protein